MPNWLRQLVRRLFRRKDEDITPPEVTPLSGWQIVAHILVNEDPLENTITIQRLDGVVLEGDSLIVNCRCAQNSRGGRLRWRFDIAIQP